MMKKLVSLSLVIMLLVCGTALAEQVTVTDFMGREVSIDKVPEKVVSLTAANTEILYALGLGDKLVGRDAYSDYPAETADITVAGDYNGPNVELIVSLEPDVVFASTGLQAEAVEQLTSLGITVVCVEPTAYEDIPKGINMIAQIMGADASNLLASMKETEEAAVQGTSAIQPKVYFALSYGEYGDWTAGAGTFIDTMITMAGGVNVAHGADTPWPSYSMEQLVLDDPDVILLSAYDESAVDQFCAAEGYKELRAVKEGHVYAIDANTSSRPGPRIVEALQQIADVLKPASETEDAA